MLIHTLQIRDFRNIKTMDAEFSPGINVIYGTNAQGKTNLLESIYLLVTGRSFRTTNESELTPWQLNEYNGTLIRATISKSAGEEQITLFINGREKRVSINGKPIDRLLSLIGRLNAVLFTPTDLLLVRGAPAQRRRFIDIAVGQVNARYLSALQTYQHVLKNRNILLKRLSNRDNAPTEQLDVYDAQLAECGAIIIKTRTDALTEVGELGSNHYSVIAGNSEAFSLQYLPDVASVPDTSFTETLLAALLSSRNEDIRRLSTSRGPHRDDFQFMIQGHPARHFASQGQQRTAVLALKLAEMEYLRSHSGEAPLLMLDDLMSELDEHRKKALLKHLQSGVQTFITTTDPDSVTSHTTANKLLHISSGKINATL